MTVDELQQKYPGARAWGFGDSPHMADELGALVAHGTKRASCSDYHAWRQEADPTLRGITTLSSTARASRCALFAPTRCGW